MHLTLFTAYKFLMGVLAGAGLLYLLYAQRYVVPYRRFLYFLVTGLLVFAVGGPLADIFAPGWAHIVHGVSAVFVIFGLYNPVHNDLRRDEWAQLLLHDPILARNPAEWMRPIDDQILQLFHSSHLVLTPSIIAYNIDYSAKEVNRRLSTLAEHGLVAKVERGKYQLTDTGERYLRGELVDEAPAGDGV